MRVHGVWRGAEAERAVPCVRREAEAVERDLGYTFWPGPNGNTFIDVILRACGF